MLISVIFVLLLYGNTFKEIPLFSYFPVFIWETFLKLMILFSLGNATFTAVKHSTSRFLCLFIKIFLPKFFSVSELPINFFCYYEHEFFGEAKLFKYLFLELIFFSHQAFSSQKTLENKLFGISFNEKVCMHWTLSDHYIS